jgi:DNA polymerase-3 subunit delta
MSGRTTLDSILASLEGGGDEPVYLISGNLVLSEPAGRKLAEALAARGGAEVEVARRPTRLGELLGDLRTYSLFAGCRVMLVVESALLADRSAAAALVDEVVEVLPTSTSDAELDRRERAAAGRLLQVLRLFELDPYAGAPGEIIARLPAWALEGAPKKGRRKRAKGKVEELRGEMARLLEMARLAGLQGTAESDLAELSELLENGLPAGHALVLVESAVSDEHPIVEALRRRRVVLEVGQVESSRRGGWQGVDALSRQLSEETGVTVAPDALDELARRTLRQQDGGRSPRAEADSTARFAAEYRKLASLVGKGRIGVDVVRATVDDRGDEDVWKILDAIGAGRAGEALKRIDRYQAAAEDETASRFALFGLIAGFCRQLTAIEGVMRLHGVPGGVGNYNQFKSSLAPRLQAELEGGGDNPLKGLHPFRLHRAYLAASRLPSDVVARLPWRVLETELRLKGESRDAQSALALLVTELATAA